MGQGPSQPKAGTTFRVIGAGMSRTGTKSFAEALTIALDAPVHDAGVQSLAGSAHQRKAWSELMRLAPVATTHADEKQVDALLAKLMEGYCATVDGPSNLLTPELLRVFPDAIVIATTRDSSSWYRSLRLMNSMTDPWYVHVVVYWIPVLGNFHRYMRELLGMYAWRFGRRELLITDLARHEEQLREVVPPDRLFFYNCRDGWQPLCKILGVPVPQQPFPHHNKPDDAIRVFRGLMIYGLSLWAAVLGATSLAGYVVWNKAMK
ncbi:hypothetical protein QQS21_007316 [Conoideocrella luteorostrata]|uniref:NAD dependent epimerase/dehydratase n=1 Tax=Conoideocrella luteorostrata TaxID=1105319 RepID=A0AAJ0FXH0_9HYPO|nr:hypothetical protein QQS21_007316 [Conoideocrella luteorostrata]